MTTTASPHDLQALGRRLQELTDRIELTELCDRYVRHLDKDRADDAWLGSVFTEDAHLTFPFGEFNGIEGLKGFQAMARTTVERTHHLSSNYDIRLDGDRARIGAHLMAVHVRRSEEPSGHFTIGGHYEADAVRTDEGWRIRTFVFDLVWNAGDPPTGKV
ncbi:nuclear transport factor 2 family protein [Streptomyces sp. HUAS MG47]|uniref:nuclear transport factor 2 family protein n=1 Tax=Streptomyces solicamelliae TaxID=3231716 RepID=UPI00387811DB